MSHTTLILASGRHRCCVHECSHSLKAPVSLKCCKFAQRLRRAVYKAMRLFTVSDPCFIVFQRSLLFHQMMVGRKNIFFFIIMHVFLRGRSKIEEAPDVQGNNLSRVQHRSLVLSVVSWPNFYQHSPVPVSNLLTSVCTSRENHSRSIESADQRLVGRRRVSMAAGGRSWGVSGQI